ncbi:hypothetical protein SAMN02910358_01074 [Lachnospiraceae bacterium XBB1006]|nr:hypothetical protein SAMN02910358_01074 [Lachnospiraceae bacterium XBB1006]
MMNRRAPAVISVFATITFVLVAGFVCALLEGARMQEMRTLLKPRTHLMTQNILSNYQRELYDAFGILGLDEEYTGMPETVGAVSNIYAGEFEKEQEVFRKSRGLSFLNYGGIHVDDESFQVLTDGNGEVFFREAGQYMLGILPQKQTEALLRGLSERKSFQEEHNTEKTVAGAKAAVDAASAMQEGEDSEPLSCGTFEDYEKKKAEVLLPLLQLDKKPSHNKILHQYCPSRRNFIKGSMETTAVGGIEKAAGVAYCLKKFRNYRNAKEEDEGVQYQVEYVLGGQDEDADNLEVVARKILGLREAVQFARFMRDAAKKEEAHAAAVALVGFTLNPALIRAVQLGFLAVWSLEEARKDVGRLLNGEKLSLLTEKEGRFGYEDYLKLLLFMEKPSTLGMRACDVIENVVNEALRVGEFHADYTIVRMSGEVRAATGWFFANLFFLPRFQKDGLDATTVVDASYAG